MRTSTIAACLLLTGFVVAAPVAASPSQKAKAPASAKVHSAWASGTLEKFDPAAHTLVLKHDGKDQTYTLGDAASIMNGKQKAAAADLAANIGKAVKVEYAMNNGARTVSVVEIAGAPAHPATKK